jgi:DNA-binding MarR family transcriptional regulator
MERSLKDSFIEVYDRFKLQFYKRVFSRFATREASLTTVETFCIEAINALGAPTMGEFAAYVHVSQANATYRIQNLEKKGYVVRRRSSADKREVRLYPTERFEAYNHLSTSYVATVAERMKTRFSADEIRHFQYMLDTIAADLMPETAPYCAKPSSN